MKRKKMSLANIKERLSRAEMKKILAGSQTDTVMCNLQGFGNPDPCIEDMNCSFTDGKPGTCRNNTAKTKCYCTSVTVPDAS